MSSPGRDGDFRIEPPAGSGEPGAQEGAALAELARELRAAYPDPELSPGFLERCAAAGQAPPATFAPVWSFRAALRVNPLLRAAVGLLVFLLSSVPVLGLIQLLQERVPEPPMLGFEPPLPAPPVDRRAAPERATVPPEAPPLAELLNEEWRDAVEQENRLRRAALSWSERFGARAAAAGGTVPPDAPELPVALRRALAVRLGWLAAAAVPALADWAAATPLELWAELERRLAQGELAAPHPALLRRVAELWSDAPEQRPWLYDWKMLLDGTAPVADDWPSPPLATPLPGAWAQAVLAVSPWAAATR